MAATSRCVKSATTRARSSIAGVLALVDRHRPLHVSIVGGEPLVRYRELNTLLPMLAERGIYVQLVTSAVREIPAEWRGLDRLQIVVSIDGLQPEHDVRRAPATYDAHPETHRRAPDQRALHGHGQQTRRDGYLEEFVRSWSARDEVEKIWISLYTPQVGEESAERLDARDRARVVADLCQLRTRYSKLQLPEEFLRGLRQPAEIAGGVPLLAADDDRVGESADGRSPRASSAACPTVRIADVSPRRGSPPSPVTGCWA